MGCVKGNSSGFVTPRSCKASSDLGQVADSASHAQLDGYQDEIMCKGHWERVE